MRLGDHFTYEEMTRTSRDWDNVPANIHIINLTRLVCLVLDPLRKDVGRIDVTSGFRSVPVNRQVGGSSISFHLHGLAADITSPTKTAEELMAIIHALGLGYDKLIAEDNGKARWLHVQIQTPETPNRKERYNARMVDGVMKYEKV